jgi:tRNA (guanine-N1)-methyltransferase
MSTEPIAIRSASPSGGPADGPEPGAAVSPVPEPFMAGADEGVAVPASVALTADVPAAATTAPERGSAGSGAADQGVAANLVAIPAAAIDGQAERDSSAPCRLRLDVISLVPEAFAPLQGLGVIGRALRAGIAEVHLHNPRDFATDRYRKVDDVPYGGGAGMVLKPEPVFAAFDSVPVCSRRRVLLMSPQGRPLHQRDLQRWATDHDQLVLLCGHYEGFDERIRSLADEEVSLGDFVLTGGELPAMVIINGVIRLLPGTVGTAESLEHESHSDLLLEHPHYTRPPEFQGMAVPEVLRSGDHGAIARWRLEQQLRRTSERRPDLFARWQEQQQEQQKKEG